jgi:hypothetical protein
VKSIPSELCDEFAKLNIVANTEVMEMEFSSSLLQEIQKGQWEHEKIQEVKHNITEEKSASFSVDDQGVLWYKGRICVPNVKELKDKMVMGRLCFATNFDDMKECDALKSNKIVVGYEFARNIPYHNLGLLGFLGSQMVNLVVGENLLPLRMLLLIGSLVRLPSGTIISHVA